MAGDSPAAILVARLDGVRERGPGCWIARCPAHEDRTPSLSVRETQDGTILLHCFAGCSPADILAAVGLELRDLFPRRPEHYQPPLRDRRHYAAARDAITLLSAEADVVLLAAENIIQNATFTDNDLERVRLAADRIRQVKGVVT